MAKLPVNTIRTKSPTVYQQFHTSLINVIVKMPPCVITSAPSGKQYPQILLLIQATCWIVDSNPAPSFNLRPAHSYARWRSLVDITEAKCEELNQTEWPISEKNAPWLKYTGCSSSCVSCHTHKINRSLYFLPQCLSRFFQTKINLFWPLRKVTIVIVEKPEMPIFFK